MQPRVADSPTQARSSGVPCCQSDAELWFAESPDDLEYAKSLCRRCPVVRRCLEGALDRAEPCGVWGGEIFVQGVVVPRKPPRGRPGKTRSSHEQLSPGPVVERA